VREPPDCTERGLLLLSLAVQHIVADDNAAAQELAARAAGIGRHKPMINQVRQFGEPSRVERTIRP
jgi:hypothetical protein